MRKRMSGLLLLLLCTLLLAGCRQGSLGKGEYAYQIFFMQKSRMEFSKVTYYTNETNPEELIPELWQVFTTTPEDADVVTISNGTIALQDWNIEQDTLSLYFSPEYKQMDKATELLFRAGVVGTFGQLSGVESILFYTDGYRLTDSEGRVITAMKPEDFVDITGEEVNSVQISNIALYYANAAGDTLLPYTMKIAYSSNTSIEEFILEQLIEGPGEEGFYPVLDSDVKVNSVQVKGRICYVDFNQAFLNTSQPVEDNIVIYSIVNSLCELSGVYQVQFSVDGVSNVKFQDTIQLNQAFERNLDYANAEEKLKIVEEGLGIYY